MKRWLKKTAGFFGGGYRRISPRSVTNPGKSPEKCKSLAQSPCTKDERAQYADAVQYNILVAVV